MAGDYRAGFYMAGATLILAAVFLVVLDQFQQRSEKGNHTSTKSEKLSLPYTSFHFLKLQKRRYQDHDVAVWLHWTSCNFLKINVRILGFFLIVGVLSRSVWNRGRKSLVHKQTAPVTTATMLFWCCSCVLTLQVFIAAPQGCDREAMV